MDHTHDHAIPKVGNADLYPTYIAVQSGIETVDRLRGIDYFELLKETGLHVHLPVQPEPLDRELFSKTRCTFLFMHVPYTSLRELMESFTRSKVLLVLDCHFPIMNMEKATFSGSEEEVEAVFSKRDVLLDNLAVAHAVTTPHPEWSAALAEINSNVWTLPDVGEPEDVMQFGIIFNELVTSTMLSRSE